MILPDLPDTTRDAIHKTAAALRRSKMVLAAASLAATRARQRLDEADARADLLQAKMAHVKYATQRPA